MNDSQDILDGFNAGYILKQERPEVFKHLENSFQDVDLPFFNSFKEGGKEFTNDRFRSLIINKELPEDKRFDLDKNAPEMDV